MAVLSWDNYWQSEWFVDLAYTLRHHRAETHEALAYALEQFWEHSRISEAAALLTRARNLRLVGGVAQDWLDPESALPAAVANWVQ